MSFSLFEADPNRGVPIELFTFEYGASAPLRYTNAEVDLKIDGVDYRAIPISRGNIKVDGKTDRKSLTIQVDKSAEVAFLFLGYPPTETVVYTIRAGHYGDPDNEFVVISTGRVLSHELAGAIVSLSCEHAITSLKRLGLRRRYQHGCPFVLYSAQCGASKDNATREVTVVEAEGMSITLEPNWMRGEPADRFVGGMIGWTSSFGNEYRTILRCSGSGVLTVAGNFRGIDVGTKIKVSYGCAHTMDHCRDLHKNINNFGGQPWIPFTNPYKTRLYW